LSELGTEEERFSRKMLKRRPLECGREHHPGDAEEDEGEDEGGEERKDKHGLLNVQPGKSEKRSATSARSSRKRLTMADSRSPDSNATNSGMDTVAWGVLIVGTGT